MSPRLDTSAVNPRSRFCLVERRVLPCDVMVRFVVSLEGGLTPDLAERLPGRGFWVHATRPCLNQAVDKGLFGRVARRRVNIEDDLVGRVETLLLRRCQDFLALARRSGQAVCGFENVQAHVTATSNSLVFLAADAARHAIGRTASLLKRVGREREDVERVLIAQEMGQPFGRQHAVHAAVAAGGVGDRLRRDCRRLWGMRRSSS